ncbi:MAG: hypothetical protein AAGL98_15375 [Planctomycetota bacterium]
MESNGPPQIKNETLEIDDTRQTTEGGPPIWIALAIVGGLFLAIAAAVFMVLYLI